MRVLGRKSKSLKKVPRDLNQVLKNRVKFFLNKLDQLEAKRVPGPELLKQDSRRSIVLDAILTWIIIEEQMLMCL